MHDVADRRHSNATVEKSEPATHELPLTLGRFRRQRPSHLHVLIRVIGAGYLAHALDQ